MIVLGLRSVASTIVDSNTFVGMSECTPVEMLYSAVAML